MNYLLSYNPLDLRVSSGQVDGFVRANRYVDGWYSPFPGTYCLKSSHILLTLTESFRPMFAETAFILTFVPPQCQGGALPPPIWNWINTPDPAPFPLTALTRPSS